MGCGNSPGPDLPKLSRLSASKFHAPPHGLVAVHQHVVFPAHLPVEEFHAELLAPFRMGGELLARR
jgi:hypothetical protein